MKFITTRTKVTGIVASAITVLALITLAMISTLINFTPTTRIVLSLIYSTCLMLVMLIWKGILDIFVFKEYKCTCKHLCAEGVLNICMGALLAITGILFAVFQGNEIIHNLPLATVDIRYFLFGFIISMCIWKLTEMILSIKHKHYDKVIDIINFALWLILSGLVLSTIYVGGNVLTIITWIVIGTAWTLIVFNCLSILISYVIKEPTYLESEEAIRIRQEELDAIELSKEKEKRLIKGKSAKSNLEQLKQLFEKNLISQKDYDKKRQEIISNLFND